MFVAGLALGIAFLVYAVTHPITFSTDTPDTITNTGSVAGGTCAAGAGGSSNSNDANKNKTKSKAKSNKNPTSQSTRPDVPQASKPNIRPVSEAKPASSQIRSLSMRNNYLKSIIEKSPRWMRQSLQNGKVPGGHQVHHIRPLYKGGIDSIENMSIRDIETHKTATRLWRLIK